MIAKGVSGKSGFFLIELPIVLPIVFPIVLPIELPIVLPLMFHISCNARWLGSCLPGLSLAQL